jgi:pimeloyl-ACP methyl ester carboxylesterase
LLRAFCSKTRAWSKLRRYTQIWRIVILSRRSIILLSILALLACASGCSRSLGRDLVTAPNLDLPARGHDAPPDVMRSLCITKQRRVPVVRDTTWWVTVTDPTTVQESLSLQTDGLVLRALIHREPTTLPVIDDPPPKPRGTIVMLHGLQEDQEGGAYFVYREMLVHAGYRCVQVDLRGHGRSTGKWVTFGVLESRDLVKVLDELEARNLVAGDVGAIGASYGASIAIEWAGIDPRVKAVVALEPFATLEDGAVDAAPFVLGKWRKLVTQQTLRNAVYQAGKIAHFDPNDANPLVAITRTTAPVLLIHSRDDELVPVSHSRRLHAEAPDHSKLVLVDKQSHFTMWFQSINLIRRETIQWLDEYVAHEPRTIHPQVPQIRNRTQYLTHAVE